MKTSLNGHQLPESLLSCRLITAATEGTFVTGGVAGGTLMADIAVGGSLFTCTGGALITGTASEKSK